MKLDTLRTVPNILTLFLAEQWNAINKFVYTDFHSGTSNWQWQSENRFVCRVSPIIAIGTFT